MGTPISMISENFGKFLTALWAKFEHIGKVTTCGS